MTPTRIIVASRVQAMACRKEANLLLLRAFPILQTETFRLSRCPRRHGKMRRQQEGDGGKTDRHRYETQQRQPCCRSSLERFPSRIWEGPSRIAVDFHAPTLGHLQVNVGQRALHGSFAHLLAVVNSLDSLCCALHSPRNDAHHLNGLIKKNSKPLHSHRQPAISPQVSTMN